MSSHIFTNTPLRRPAAAGQAAWLLIAGLALVGMGLVTGAQINQTGQTTPQAGSVASSAFGTADSNRTMIAVTGHDVTGGSLLYLVDTESKQLAVYTAQGGTASTSKVRFIGARRIDLDLQVDGYNDESEYSWQQLDKEFKKAADPSRKSAQKRKPKRSDGPVIPQKPRTDQ